MKKGVLLIAFGKRGYFFAAYNLAMSIKSLNSAIHITLIHGKINQLGDFRFFDEMIEMPEDMYMEDGVIDPGKAKVSYYDLLKRDEYLYLDIDALCLKDIQPIIDHCSNREGFYLTDVTGTGKKEDTINYSIWAKHKDIWPFFKLNKDSIYPAIQSSFCYIKRGEKAKAFFDKAKDNYALKFPIKDLTMSWGKTMPDELLFSVTCAQLGVNPKAGIKPIFFGFEYASISSVKDNFSILSIYGNGNGTTLTKLRFWEYYDKLGRKYQRSYPSEDRVQFFKSLHIKKDKHANLS